MNTKKSSTSAIPFLITCIFVILFTTRTQAQESNFDSMELVIRFEAGTPQAIIDSFKLAYNATEDTTISPSPVSGIHLWTVSSFPAGSGNNLNDINEVVNDAQSMAEVNSAGLNYETELIPYSYDNNCQQMAIDPTVFCESDFSTIITPGNSAVKIAILDTGIGYSIDIDGARDFKVPFLFEPYFESYFGYNFIDRNLEPKDDHGHGTHTAGIIAELIFLAGNDEISLESYKTHNGNGVGTVFNIVLAVDEIILQNYPSPSVINMSFGYNAPPPTIKAEPLEVAIEIAGSRNMLVVASAGNDAIDNDGVTYPAYPASFDSENILSVAAVDCEGDLAGFSNRGMNSVDVAALGEDILAPDQAGQAVLKSGTSQATAIVSTIAGQLASYIPNHDWSFIKCAIMNSVTHSADLEGKILTKGIVHAANALEILDLGCNPGSDKLEEVIQNTNPIHEQEILIYPNPFKDQVTIKSSLISEEPMYLSIYDLMGRLIYNEKLYLDEEPYLFEWHKTSHSLEGIFLFQIKSGDKISIQKIVKRPGRNRSLSPI